MKNKDMPAMPQSFSLNEQEWGVTMTSTDRMIDDLRSLRDELGWSFSILKRYRRRIETLLLQRTGMLNAFELNRMKMIEECIGSIDPEQHNTLKDGFAKQTSKLKSDLPEGTFHDDAEIMTEVLYLYLKD